MKRLIHFGALATTSAACLFLACSDEGYKGPLPTGTGGSGGSPQTTGTGDTTATTTVGSTGNTSATSATATTGATTGPTTGTGAGGAVDGTGGATSGSSSGSGGSGGAGGSGGRGGSVADAGPDTSTVVPSPIPPDMLQHKWRYVHTCKFVNGQPVSNFPTCSTGNNDICWETANGQRWVDMNPPVWKLAGDATKIYEIKLHLRAISEPKTYSNCKEVNTRTDNGTHPMVCDGTGKNVLTPGENFNVLNLRFNDPRQDFYMNMAEIDEPHRVEKLDEIFTVRARGQSTVTFLFDDLNGGEIRNCPKYTFPGVPAVAPYDNTPIDGEFWQWDCADPAGGDACWKVVP